MASKPQHSKSVHTSSSQTPKQSPRKISSTSMEKLKSGMVVDFSTTRDDLNLEVLQIISDNNLKHFCSITPEYTLNKYVVEFFINLTEKDIVLYSKVDSELMKREDQKDVICLPSSGTAPESYNQENKNEILNSILKVFYFSVQSQ